MLILSQMLHVLVSARMLRGIRGPPPDVPGGRSSVLAYCCPSVLLLLQPVGGGSGRGSQAYGAQPFLSGGVCQPPASCALVSSVPLCCTHLCPAANLCWCLSGSPLFWGERKSRLWIHELHKHIYTHTHTETNHNITENPLKNSSWLQILNFAQITFQPYVCVVSLFFWQHFVFNWKIRSHPFTSSLNKQLKSSTFLYIYLISSSYHTGWLFLPLSTEKVLWTDPQKPPEFSWDLKHWCLGCAHSTVYGSLHGCCGSRDDPWAEPRLPWTPLWLTHLYLGVLLAGHGAQPRRSHVCAADGLDLFNSTELWLGQQLRSNDNHLISHSGADPRLSIFKV